MIGEPIFIGGTGRSGTTILKRILGQHPAVFAVPPEARFIVDPDGLITLVDALSTKWSVSMSDKALRRFEDLMLSLRKVSYPYRLLRKLSRILHTS